MLINRNGSRRLALIGGVAVTALVAAGPALAEPINIKAQPAGAALTELARQTGANILFQPQSVAGFQSPAVNADISVEDAARQIVSAADLVVLRDPSGALIIRQEGGSSPQGAGAGGDVDALIVTAQKREENIQDVPIAISAFSQEDLTRSQVAGGPDLITQVPNMTFTKTNFSSYSIQIRGIGTQAISATTDPAVAVAFNNTPFIRNRFFEQEFYDLQRVEVLRGPQGTLYGRNATGGVVNIISAKPKFVYEAKASADISNYSSSRVEAMVNIPLVEDAVALRVAGAWTKRDGYAINELSGDAIDGRDLWSTRLSLRFSPNDRIDANLIWEHFQEDDDRLRSGKQLCKKDVVQEVAGFATPDYYMSLPTVGLSSLLAGPQLQFSQGCKRESLYDQSSFQRPNGLMLPYYMPLSGIGLPTALRDPYVSVVNSSDPAVIDATNDQPEDLRVIQSVVDPKYRARNDLAELQISYDITDTLTLASETSYAGDMVYSLQDFNRFNTAPGAWDPTASIARSIGVLDANGVFCDPQLGCSDRLMAVDIASSQSSQFSQELRLGSDFDGAFNFSLGANFLRADSKDKYYVFINSLSMIAALAGSDSFGPRAPYVYGQTDNFDCLTNGYASGDPNNIYPVADCVYMDPNPIESVNDQGHNYFLSNNPYKLISYAVFGEAYYNISENLKLTAGLRWTVDKKEAPRIPTWILVSNSYGYPVAETIEQEWREPTGRLTLDWKPDLSFTDETLLYASYAHGYKAGGANPPGFVRVYYADRTAALSNSTSSATRPKTFDPEFVDAFELGAKNTFLDGRATLNLAAFYYDYKDYQISEIVDRSAFNRNFDATVWGVELESDWRPLENLRLGFKGGYEKTRIADSEQAIDLMDRTAGDPNWVVVRPFPTFASSCILPAWLLVGNNSNTPANPELVALGNISGGGAGGCELAYQQGLDPVLSPDSSNVPRLHDGIVNYTAWSTDPNDYAGLVWPGGIVTNRTYPGWDPSTAPNGGEGIMKPLGGNELPNAPHWTATVTGDYTAPLPNDWLMTLHTDIHWQSQSWWRVFNDHTYDKLHPYFTMNLAAIFTNEEAGWNVMAYIKNVTDETAITGAFLNSDDTGLTTNVFLTEPRLYGIRVTKNFTGGPLLGSFGERREGAYPFTLELGGQVQRHDAPNDPFQPSFKSAFPAPLDLVDGSQSDGLDWGDGREVRLAWRPSDGPWTLSAGMRFGKTNGRNNPSAEQLTDPACGYAGYYAYYCDLLANDPNRGSKTHLQIADWARADVVDREEHRIVDLVVGRDVGFGGLKQSTFELGVRYARLESTTFASFDGVPDWNLVDGFIYPGPNPTHTDYHADGQARRQFEGFGPTLSWKAKLPLLPVGDSGAVDLDWSITGGVLYGDQESSVALSERMRTFETLGRVLDGGSRRDPEPLTDVPSTPIDARRTRSVTVPTLDASLGLSYRIGGVTTGLGYRWERYFDALDVGSGQAAGGDRTIHGPYLKLAIGFGG